MVLHVLMEKVGRSFLGAILPWAPLLLTEEELRASASCACKVQQGHVLRKHLKVMILPGRQRATGLFVDSSLSLLIAVIRVALDR